MLRLLKIALRECTPCCRHDGRVLPVGLQSAQTICCGDVVRVEGQYALKQCLRLRPPALCLCIARSRQQVLNPGIALQMEVLAEFGIAGLVLRG